MALRNYYKENSFHSHVVQQSPPLYIELSTIFRQTDTEFISVLNLRDNKITATDVAALNKYVQPDFDLKTKDTLHLLRTIIKLMR
jgi:hypothetical protein